jgi:hypothetical protein
MGALALMLTALVFGWSGAGSTQKAEAVVDPVATLQTFIDKVNAGDAAGAAAMFTEDGWFADVDGGSFQASGRPALEFIFGEPTPGQHVTLLAGSTLTSTVSGTQVDGMIEYTDDDVVTCGQSRYIQPFVAQITDDGLISSLYLTYDTSDSETAAYLACQAAQPEEGGPQDIPGTIEVAIGGDQPGSAFLAPLGGGVLGVFLSIEPGPAGVQQPAHIHTGSCEPGGGPIAYPLASVLDGESFSFISADLDALLAGDYYINVHESETAMDVSVACGDVAAVVALPSTGDGGASGSDSPALLLALLGMVGLAFVTGGLVRARRA